MSLGLRSLRRETLEMRVAELQIQLKAFDKRAEELIHAIDPSAPLPSPLEGGNGQGPVYLCILQEDHLKMYKQFCEKHSESFIIYSGPFFFDMDAEKYSPEWMCHWSMDGFATLTKARKNQTPY